MANRYFELKEEGSKDKNKKKLEEASAEKQGFSLLNMILGMFFPLLFAIFLGISIATLMYLRPSNTIFYNQLAVKNLIDTSTFENYEYLNFSQFIGVLKSSIKNFFPEQFLGEFGTSSQRLRIITNMRVGHVRTPI